MAGSLRCYKANCGGTLQPITPPSTNVCECDECDVAIKREPAEHYAEGDGAIAALSQHLLNLSEA